MELMLNIGTIIYVCAPFCMPLLQLGSCILLTQDIEFNEQHMRGFTTLSYGQILRKYLQLYIEYGLHEKSLRLISKFMHAFVCVRTCACVCAHVCAPEKMA